MEKKDASIPIITEDLKIATCLIVCNAIKFACRGPGGECANRKRNTAYCSEVSPPMFNGAYSQVSMRRMADLGTAFHTFRHLLEKAITICVSICSRMLGNRLETRGIGMVWRQMELEREVE